jgi:hypothetical protein
MYGCHVRAAHGVVRGTTCFTNRIERGMPLGEAIREAVVQVVGWSYLSVAIDCVSNFAYVEFHSADLDRISTEAPLVTNEPF